MEGTKTASEKLLTDHPLQPRPYIVGIGSSAGGLEALSAMIAALPSNLGISYVVIQHLSPTHKSMLVQLLGRETSMAVCEILDQMTPEADVIYIAPASRNTIYKDGRFILLETKRETLPKPSVNVFLASLASEKTEDAMGVILSGTGSDGTAGLREIKVNGGFTFAQQLDTAKYIGMPQSAIDSGCVDWVLAPEKIAAEITNIVRNRTTISHHTALVQPQSIATQLKKLLINVKQKTRIDFGGYKEGTLWRRIERRMAANHIILFEDYLKFTEEVPEELERLSRDILISVTAFFRDQEAFSQLKHTIKAIVSNKQAGEEIRIWVPACATGEEAYSIAILLMETLGSHVSRYKIQIFATDIDNSAMNIARKGSYIQGSLAEIDPKLISRYFSVINDRYEICRAIRDMLVFARQDLVLDPPFLRLDLISCRNVLIYLQPELQAKVLATFHFGLAESGYLFLGKSESVYQQDNLFDVVDKSHRIYRRRASASKIPVASIYLPHANSEQNFLSTKKNTEHKLLEVAIRMYIPPSILVNGSLDIQHIYGEVSHYLAIPPGKPSTNLMHLLRRELRPDLQLLQHKVEQSLDSVTGRARDIPFGESVKTVRL
ncbi:MAG: PAS domain S-box protein, partial [Nitrosomonadaceae bacterium]|nr:PAS domain S-box protein [Nitrosomonadaceae bacterium]